jgi:nitrogen regulatory protein PII
MSYMVILVVNNVDQCPELLDAWEDAGVLGVTILPSTGIGHIRRALLRDDISIMPSLNELFQSDEVQHRTLLSVVDTQEMVDRMIVLVREIIGDLENPNTGFLFVLPVLQAFGLGLHRTDRTDE